MIYVVLGMHKSGTTLISQILHHSDINMGENIDIELTYDKGNQYERESTRALNMEILGLDDIYDPTINLGPAKNVRLTQAQRNRMQKIIQHYNDTYTDWGFKDPRTTPIYHLWASVLPKHKIIAIYRSHDEIWPRYRHKRFHYLYKNPLKAWRFLSKWCEYNSSIFTCLQKPQDDYIVLNYQEFMTNDTEFFRLQEFVGKALADHRRKELYRSRAQHAPLIKVINWMYAQKTGYTYQDIMGQLATLQEKSNDATSDGA